MFASDGSMISKFRVSLIATLIAALMTLPLTFWSPGFLDEVRNIVFDNFQRIKPLPYDPEAPVRVVGVDEESLKAFGQWPWPRTRIAELVDRLREYGAGAIVLDIIFSEPDQADAKKLVDVLADPKLRSQVSKIVAKAPDNDTTFANSINRAPVVLAAALISQGSTAFPTKSGVSVVGDDPSPFLTTFPSAILPLSGLSAKAQGLGATNWLPDRDLVVRRVPLLLRNGQSIVPSLAIEALRVAQNEPSFIIRSSNASGENTFGAQTGINAIKVGQFEIATGPASDVRLRYGLRNPARDISAKSILERTAPREEIEGRIIFVGAVAIGLGDVKATPLEPIVPGVELHAEILEALTSGALLTRPDWARGLEFLVASISFAATMLILFLAPIAVSSIFPPALVALIFAASFYLFDKKSILIDPVYPSLVVIVAYLIGLLALWWYEKSARRQVRNAFGKFLAPAVVDKLAENPKLLVLGGETRDLTVLFSDLRNFSGISEKMSARELTEFMNAYLTPMTDAILEREGTVDKYIGDAILAFWNAPLDIANHTEKALMAALDMRRALGLFNERRARAAQTTRDDYVQVRMGCGINLGPCSVGNMGSVRRFDYSILGDNVNLASRLEGASKAFGVDILVSGSAQNAAPQLAWLDLGEVIVVGRHEPTAVFALAGDSEFAKSQEYQRWRIRHDEMLIEYKAGSFRRAAEMARDLAQALPGIWPSLYSALGKRYADLEMVGVTVNWSPVWELKSK